MCGEANVGVRSYREVKQLRTRADDSTASKEQAGGV